MDNQFKPDWQPSAALENLRLRAAMLSTIRQFFAQRGVLEVETPLMCQAGVTDVHLAAFTTEFNSPSRVGQQTLYLQTSPEFAMKRLLCAGMGSIYQICKAFRNEESGRYHNPEFTLLEWYRVGFDHNQLIAEIEQLLQLTLNCQPLQVVSYQALFNQYCGCDPLTADLALLQQIAIDHGFENIAKNEQSADTLQQLLFSHLVEPEIGRHAPVCVTHFPASQAALAKLEEQDMRVARRFEIYFKGIELANGFEELTDRVEQQQRFNRDNSIRNSKGIAPVTPDQRFLDALESGLPDCSGVALGIDRLLMLLSGSQHISQVLAFDIDRA